ncbi:MAG: hypothetical protein ABSA93_07790 [Streptosporangiaceae bacterium]|jgi:hypothetical protein
MITLSNRAALLVLTALTLTACGSSGHSATTNTAATAQTTAQQTCQQVSAVLSDGPDPGSDPVGYAEAQVLPLRQIQTSDATIGKAISALADDYNQFYTADGHGSTINSALNTAINKINALCPGAGATT